MKDESFFEKELKNNLIETFEDVKKIVKKHEGHSRAGLMLGLQEIGASLDGFIGAYFPVSSNIIVMNKTPLRRINETKPEILKPYGFHVLLHEYIHTIGFLDESVTRKKTYEISKKQFAENHIITKLSTNIKDFFPNLVYPIYGWLPTNISSEIELVKGFNYSNVNNYIT